MKHAKKHKTNAIRVVGLTVVALVLGLSLYNWNAKHLTGNQMPMPFGYGMSIVLSGSMEPTLSVNDLVIIKQTDSLNPNDIVVFQDGHSLVIHRVKTIDGNQITTKGDANDTADAPINRLAVKGVLVCAVPYVGVVVNIVKQPVVMVLLIVGCLFLTERSFRKEKNTDTDELTQLQDEIKTLMNELKAQ